MPTLIQLTAQIVSAHIYNKQLTSEEIQQDLQKVHASLKALEAAHPDERQLLLPVNDNYNSRFITSLENSTYEGFREAAETEGARRATGVFAASQSFYLIRSNSRLGAIACHSRGSNRESSLLSL